MSELTALRNRLFTLSRSFVLSPYIAENHADWLPNFFTVLDGMIGYDGSDSEGSETFVADPFELFYEARFSFNKIAVLLHETHPSEEDWENFMDAYTKFENLFIDATYEGFIDDLLNNASDEYYEWAGKAYNLVIDYVFPNVTK